MNWPKEKKVLALCGGVGGAKLALGLSKILPPEQLSIAVNTADDFNHLGLRICPDLDTVTYTLAGVNNQESGWGRANESWHCMEALTELGGETWFKLGDRDLATHLFRRAQLDQGFSISQVTENLCRHLGITHSVFPMSDDQVGTEVKTDSGWLDFQRYFVEQQCQPQISQIRFVGSETAQPSPRFKQALEDNDLGCIIICPSNPFLSIDPVLAVSGIRKQLAELKKPVLAVSPVIGGKAVKGPTAKIMQELALEITPSTVVSHYADFLTGFVLDNEDAAQRDTLPASLAIQVCNTLMISLEDRISLAQACLQLAQRMS
ncbi:MAG: 2-phospho-L-lactate transferase [Pseudomonadales bacterium]|nr:2-phospho-L-lactate transferase [Pseudomonadales bacterium]